MSRLIDADDFKKFLQALCKAGAPYEEVVQLLDNQPIAYDVEKVVAELREELCPEKECFEDEDDYMLAEKRHNKAIDIVKAGGVK